MSVNNVVLCGRLTKDPELRYAPSGTPIVRFTVAVNRNFKREGEQEADFISCVAFNKTAESLANFQKKGNLIAVVGRIQTGSYEKDGQRIYTTDVIANEIQFLEPRSSDNAQSGGQQQQYNAPQQQYNAPPQQQNNNQQSYQQNQPPQQNYSRMDEDPFANSRGPIEVSEDDLPFD